MKRNRANFSITFSGDVALADDTRHFKDEVLSPNSPKSEYFDISIVGQYGAVYYEVTAHFCNLHRISKMPVSAFGRGNLSASSGGIKKMACHFLTIPDAHASLI